ncbi:MAG: trypsin-like peptidase domain-containing protein, partial [Bacteroidales bacterium]|nr:trypsin-like peptidase domain-containing protein [Bacteroidales bacterium]
MILPGGWIGWCTGSMINNTTWDLTPYVLTAHHCGEDCLATHFNQWIFYFKYEAATCTGSTGPQNVTMTGCSLKAEGDRYTGSDFALLLLNSTPPSSHEPFWAGWNRTNTPSPSGVGIHHPAGDIKKISTYNSPLGESQWNNNGVLSHWKAVWSATVNGISIVEEGSSGSPLFDSEHRIVGDLGGGPGNQSCENTSYSLYGKVYWSWDKMGSQPHQQLQYWLDPISTGDFYLPGTDGNDPICDFEADDPSVPLGGNVDFTDLSMGNPENWSWSFPGGE